jgi:hypothetical protein
MALPPRSPMDADMIERAGGMNASTARRLSTLETLARGIAENTRAGLPGLIDVPIAEASSAGVQIATPYEYFRYSATPASNQIGQFSIYGGDPVPYTPFDSVRCVSGHIGDGSDPTANTFSFSPVIRFQTFAPVFEVLAYAAYGFRIRVNGKYLKTGMYCVAGLNGVTASLRSTLFDFTGTEFEGSGLKQVSIEPRQDFRFMGIRLPATYSVAPWPKALPIKAALHGDSMMNAVIDTVNDYRLEQQGGLTETLRQLTGIEDIWNNSITNSGFTANASGTRSTFMDQLPVDFSGAKFDLVWECGGRNDVNVNLDEAGYTDLVKTWIAAVLADNPDALIIMTGPITVKDSENYATSANMAAIQRAKKAACAAYPRNCAFIETAGNATVTHSSWVYGTGRVDSLTANGNADLIVGTDGLHPSTFGRVFYASRLVAETAAVIPMLRSRILYGVIEGVNDLDIAA